MARATITITTDEHTGGVNISVELDPVIHNGEDVPMSHEMALLAVEYLVPMDTREAAYLRSLLDDPTDEFKELVMRLDADGCQFPRQQAALMLLNSPAAARWLLR